MRKQQAIRDRDLQSRDLQSRDLQCGAMQSLDAQHPVLHWRRIATSRRLTLFFWVYISQAVAGSVAGFIVPFLYYFGVL
ncbi:MAG: hypothetical protein ACTHJS_15660 [Xanthobacteraceae bacterium]|jgi:hypothetical protein